MMLSYRIIKNSHSNVSHEGVEIATKLRSKSLHTLGLHRDEPIADLEKEEGLSSIEEEKNLLLEEFQRSLEMERQSVMAQVMKESVDEVEALKIKARAEGFDAGFAEGSNAGEETARQEWDKRLAKTVDTIRDVEKQVEEYLEAQKENLIRLAGQMAERIVNHQIDTGSETIVNMIKEVLQEYKKGGVLVISCSRKHVRKLKENVFALKKINGDIEYVIVENPLIDGNRITMEYENQMIDMDVELQIQAMVHELIGLEV